MLHSNTDMKMRIVTRKKAQMKPSSRLVCEKCGGTIKHALFSRNRESPVQKSSQQGTIDIDFTKVHVHLDVEKDSDEIE